VKTNKTETSKPTETHITINPMLLPTES